MIENNIAITKNTGGITAGDLSAVKTYLGNATAGDYSAVRTATGDVTAGHFSAVRTHFGNAKAGDYSVARTYNGDVIIGDNSVGLGTKLGSLGENSVIALTDEYGEIIKIIVKKTNGSSPEVEIIN